MPVYVSDLPESPAHGVSLYCPKCGEHFSATRGDYFMLKPDQKFRCGEHSPARRSAARTQGRNAGGDQVSAKFTAAEVLARVATGANHTLRAYEIVRHYHPSLDRRPRRLPNAGGLTEAEAQAHCHRADTRREGVYFDGYQQERRQRDEQRRP